MEAAKIRETHNGSKVIQGNHCMIDCPTESTLATMRATRGVLREWFKSDPRRVVVLVVLPEQITAPDSSFRKELSDTWDEFGEHIIAHAVVRRGDGFAAAALRAVLTGVHMLERRSFAQRVFSTTDEAIGWLASALEKEGIRTETPATIRALLDAATPAR